MSVEIMEIKFRRQEVMRDRKWFLFRQRVRWFEYIPFVEFVLGAGSMAIGTAREESDFDVIVGIKRGRMFTARFGVVLLFGTLGIRRRRWDTHREAKNKLCFNHFVAEGGKEMRENNIYGRILEENLVPLYGSYKKMEEYLGREVYRDVRYIGGFRNRAAMWGERLLGMVVGDYIERVLRLFQIWHIERSLRRMKLPLGARIKYTDKEIEFHPEMKTFI